MFEDEQQSRYQPAIAGVPANIEKIRHAAERSPASVRPEPSGSDRGQLSDREMEVLRYLPTMLTAGEIAAELNVSVNTIKAHMRSIYGKLGVSRRQDAVLLAFERGMV